MSRATAIINKMNATLTKVAPQAKLVYLRTITRSAGDALIGRGQALTVVDTLLDPQPYYSSLGRERVPGGIAHFEQVENASGSASVADDYRILMSVTCVPLATFSSPDNVLVFRDATGDEVLRFLDAEPYVLNGIEIGYTAYFRSVKRP